jgi:hypothetical protein
MVLSSPPPAGMDGGEAPVRVAGLGADSRTSRSADLTRQLLRDAAMSGAEGGEGGAGGAAEIQGLSIFSPLDELGKALGGTGRAKLVWKSIIQGRDPFTDEDVHSNTRNLLRAKFERLPHVVHKVRAADTTTKLLVRMCDGMEIESVIIPHYRCVFVCCLTRRLLEYDLVLECLLLLEFLL